MTVAAVAAQVLATVPSDVTVGRAMRRRASLALAPLSPKPSAAVDDAVEARGIFRAEPSFLLFMIIVCRLLLC